MTDVNFHIDTETPRLVARLDQREVELPALWLRERCQDPEQVDLRTQQRLFNPHRLPIDLALTAVEEAGPGLVRLGFSDGYSAQYDLDTLAAEFEPGDGVPPARPWDASLDRTEVTFDWPSLTEDESLHAALHAFLERGFLILQGVPTDAERILEVAQVFGYVRDTNFGRYFEVFSKPDSNDLAYATVALGPHSDNPYREPVPGIQMLHCLVNETSGGLSTLVDSLAVGRKLADEDPDAFERLATQPVRFRFIDPDEELIERRCVIRRNDQGQMTGMNYSPRLDAMPLMEEREMRAYQQARRRLAELVQDPAFEIRFTLHEGELMMFDNSRVLHGRTAFDTGEGKRHLQGCYLDLDEPRSRYRALTRRLRRTPAKAEA